MSLGQHIDHILAGQSAPAYAWNDWDVLSYYDYLPDDDPLAATTDSGAMGLLLSSSEWIRRRLAPLDPDPLPFHAQMAGWAYMLDPNFCRYFEPADANWIGPVRAPLSLIIVLIMDAAYRRGEEPDLRNRTYRMANLARHILMDHAAEFDSWFDECTHKLIQHHPASQAPSKSLFDYSEDLRPVVGPDLFVPDRAYDPAKSVTRLTKGLRKSDRSNPLIDFDALDQFSSTLAP